MILYLRNPEAHRVLVANVNYKGYGAVKLPNCSLPILGGIFSSANKTVIQQ